MLKFNIEQGECKIYRNFLGLKRITLTVVLRNDKKPFVRNFSYNKIKKIVNDYLFVYLPASKDGSRISSYTESPFKVRNYGFQLDIDAKLFPLYDVTYHNKWLSIGCKDFSRESVIALAKYFQ